MSRIDHWLGNLGGTGDAQLGTITVSTKRNVTVNRRTGAAVTYLTGLVITPLAPVNQEVVRTLGLNSPREFKECHHIPNPGATLPDVQEADLLVIGGVEYPVYWVGIWGNALVSSLKIVVQEIKQNA